MHLERQNKEATETLRKAREEEMEQSSREIRRKHEEVIRLYIVHLIKVYSHILLLEPSTKSLISSSYPSKLKHIAFSLPPITHSPSYALFHTLSYTLSLPHIPTLTLFLHPSHPHRRRILHIGYYEYEHFVIQEMERIAMDQTNADNEINRIREAEAAKISKERRMDMEVRRRVSQEAIRIQESHDDDDEDGKSSSASIVTTMSRRQETSTSSSSSSARSLMRQKRIDDEVARRVETQKALLLDKQLQLVREESENMQGEIEKLKFVKEAERAASKLLPHPESLSHAPATAVRSRNGSIATANTANTENTIGSSNTRYTATTDLESERRRLLEVRHRLEEEKKRVAQKRIQVTPLVSIQSHIPDLVTNPGCQVIQVLSTILKPHSLHFTAFPAPY